MSVGKVVSGFLGKQDKDVLVHILDDQSAVCYLDERPPGDSLLRVWATKGQKRAPLVLSYKYGSFVFHHEYSNVIFRVSTEKNGAVKCKATPKHFKFIKKLASTFMMQLRLVISEFVSNKNFIEKEISSEEEIENELLGRKFIIYPQEEAVIVRKKGKEKEMAKITFNFQTFDFIANYGNNTTVFRSFNELLLTFLGIDTRDKLIVKATLGYQRDLDLFTGKQKGSDEPSLLEEEIEQTHIKPIFKPKEKDKLMEDLKQRLGGLELEHRTAAWPRKVPPPDIRMNLRRLLESVRAIHQTNEKMDWVQRGVFQYLVKIMQRNGNETMFNEVPIKIAKHLCTYNIEACRVLCTCAFECLQHDWECVGIYATFAALVALPEFAKLFIGNLGFPMLVDMYVKASIMLLGEHQTATMGDMYDPATSGLSPRSSDIFSSDMSDEETSDSDTVPNVVTFGNASESEGDSQPPSGSASAKGRVPSLVLPTLNLGKTKSKARRGSSRTQAPAEQFEQSAQAQLNALGGNLGETYMAQDLTGLMAYLQEDDEVKQRKERRVSVALRSHRALSNESDRSADLMLGNNSLYYKVKSFILKILANITANPQFFMYIPNPVNLLFSELLVCYKDGFKMYDSEFRKLVYKVLGNFANYVEYFHQYRWKEVTESMPPVRALRLRKKMDRFVWRVHNRLTPAVDSRDIPEAVLQLTLLVDYMRYCPTRVMSAQVMDVCMEALLSLKEIMLMRGKFSVETTDFAPLIHTMLEVCDELVAQNRSPIFDDVLLALLVEDQDFWLFVRDYAGQVLLKSKVERLMVGMTDRGNRGQRFTTYRLRIIRHYKVLWELLARKRGRLTSENNENRSEELHNLDILFPEMEFLLDPANGYIMQLLSSYKTAHEGSKLQHEALQFLITVFSTPGCMFVKRKKYIDSYISFSYLSFIKLYHSVQDSPEVMMLCNDHLQLLLAFSKQKTEKIILKFYQLRCMDFFAREINLEYEITLETKPPRPKSKIREAKKSLKQRGQQVASSPEGESSGGKLDSAPGVMSLIRSSAEKKNAAGGGGIPKLGLPPTALKSGSRELSTGGSGGSSSGGSGCSSAGGSAGKKLSFGKISLKLDNVVQKGTPVDEKIKEAAKEAAKDGPADDTSSSSYAESSSYETSSEEEEESDEEEGEESDEEGGEAAIVKEEKDAAETPKGEAATDASEKPGEDEKKADEEEDSGEEESSEEEGSSEEEDGSSEEESSEEESSEEEESGEDTSSEDTPLTPPAKPKGLPSLGLPSSAIKGGKSSEAAKPKLGLSLPSSAIKGGGGASSGGPPKGLSLAIPRSAIKGDSDSEQSVPGDEGDGGSDSGRKKLAMPKLKLPAERAAKKKHEAVDTAQEGMGALSQLEQKLDQHDPKLQLVFASQQTDVGEKQPKKDLMAMTEEYSRLRSERKIYQDKDMQITLLKLIFSLMMTAIGSLEPLYCDQFPLNNKKLNIPYLLKLHLNHPLNTDIIPRLANEVRAQGANEYLLLKLICTRLFQKDMYKNLVRLATGAYGAVYRCRLEPSDAQQMDVAIKLMEVPKSIHARCVVHDIFTEVLILDRFKNDARISHTYEFGVDDEYYWIIMKRYKCSLKEWRKKQTASLEQNLTLYLNIYMSVLNTFRFLEQNGVNHFDVKCDNFLIQPLNEDHWTIEDEEEFWHPTSDIPNFSLCLADFGESKIYKDELDGYTTRNRGTEFTKSPEMLAVAYASQKTRSTYDRRKKVGASSPSDIWSLGCLLYELLTGEFLFYDNDWVRFFIRVTVPGQELIPIEKQEKLLHNPALLDFLDFIFTRDPAYRPDIMDVIKKFKHVRTLITSGQAKADPSKLSRRLMRRREGQKEKSESEAIPSPAREVTLSSIETPKGDGDQSDRGDSVSPLSAGSGVPPSKKAALIHSISQKKLIFDDDKQRNTEEMMYFWRTCSQVLDWLYIGSEEAAADKRRLKNELDITHVVNASSSAPMYPFDFGILDVPQQDNEDAGIIHWIDRVVKFIDQVKAGHGKVLVYDNDGLSRCVTLAVGYLMEKNDWSFYEAFIFVKNCRYMIEPNYVHARQLCRVRREKLSRITKDRFQCLCGACTFNFVRACAVSDAVVCSCSVGENSNCPNHGCKQFLEKMLEYYQYPATSISWQFTTCSNVIGQFRKSSSEYVVGMELGIPRQKRQKLADKKWKLFKCQTCDFLTYAISMESSHDPRMVVNTNVPVGQSGF